MLVLVLLKQVTVVSLALFIRQSEYTADDKTLTGSTCCVWQTLSTYITASVQFVSCAFFPSKMEMRKGKKTPHLCLHHSWSLCP